MLWYIVGFVIVIAGLWIVIQFLEKVKASDTEVIESKADDDPAKAYEARGPLLTEAELRFYQVLKDALRHPTDPSGPVQAEVMCKVRMVDLVGIKKGLDRSAHQRAFNRINSKHVDFVLVRPGDLAVMCVIELDDSSHNTKKAKARDAFVDSVYKAGGDSDCAYAL